MTVTASGPDGTAGSFRILIRAAEQAPRLLTAPALAGSGMIGAAVGVDPGTWEDAAALALQWCRDGAEIAGATGGELHAGGGGRPDRAQLPGDREQSRRQHRGRDRGAGGRLCRAAVAAALADLERPLDSGIAERRCGGGLHRRGAELCGLRGRGDDRRRDRGGQPADRGAGRRRRR